MYRNHSLNMWYRDRWINKIVVTAYNMRLENQCNPIMIWYLINLEFHLFDAHIRFSLAYFGTTRSGLDNWKRFHWGVLNVRRSQLQNKYPLFEEGLIYLQAVRKEPLSKRKKWSRNSFYDNKPRYSALGYRAFNSGHWTTTRASRDRYKILPESESVLVRHTLSTKIISEDCRINFYQTNKE